MLATEMRNPATTHIDTASTLEQLQLIQAENMRAAAAVGQALPAIAAAVDAIVAGLRQGGRLIYLGAGTSGRLGVLDASECPPTYGVSPDLVVGVIAGGRECMFRAAEGAEDSAKAAEADMQALGLIPADTVVGISAAGGAAYVLAALRYAKQRGCTAVGLTCNADSPLAQQADVAIVTDTGAEPITGSTRMKAGSAHKMVLNMLSTCAMVQTGHVMENLMINLRPTNEKLRARVISIVRELTGAQEAETVALLDANGWVIREAVNAAGKAAP